MITAQVILQPRGPLFGGNVGLSGRGDTTPGAIGGPFNPGADSAGGGSSGLWDDSKSWDDTTFWND